MASNLNGRFKLDGGVVSFSRLGFSVPGAAINLAGSYNLRSEAMDMNGTFRMQATLADTQSGVDAATAKFTVYDQDGTVQPLGPVTVAADGSFSFTVLLQASRNGSDLTGRHYSITVRASSPVAPLTAGRSRLRMPAFSRAMLARRSPSNRV